MVRLGQSDVDVGILGCKFQGMAEVKIGTVRKVLEATGIIKAQVGAIVKIGARATGTIKEMNVKVGDEVKKDQLIAVIDDRELQAQLDEAEAKLARANAELTQVEAVYPKRIAEAEAEMHLSQAKNDYASSNLKRQDELFRKALIARDVLDAAHRDSLVGQNEVLARQASMDIQPDQLAGFLQKTRTVPGVSDVETSPMRFSCWVKVTPGFGKYGR